MNEQTLQAFIDELGAMEKGASIGSAATTAGKWLAARPQLAAHWAKAAPGAVRGWAKARPGAVAAWGKRQPKEFAEAGKRFVTPHKSIPAGWRHMTPAKQLAHLKSTGASPEAIAKYTGGMGGHITQGLTPGAGRVKFGR